VEVGAPADAAGVGRLEQRAFHGGRRQPGQTFDLSKVGSGTGAASQGWGFYFTTDVDTADDYAGRLRPRPMTPGGPVVEAVVSRVDLPEDNELLDLGCRVARPEDP
jgi:hypothetical protein